MDYFKILNLSKEPFSNSPDPEFFYHTRQHHECLQKLELALRLRRGLNVVIGDVGTGKTTLCRQLIRRFGDSDDIQTHLILDPSYASATDFLIAVAHLLKGYRPSLQAKDWQLKEVIKQHLFRSGVDQNKTIVLIIDEGQKIPVFCLEILREFLNYETNDYKLLQIVIFAQQEFEKTVQAHANFADRINLYHHLNPLNFRDTRQMITYRLEKSGSRQKTYSFFTLPALAAIFWATRGYPRKIIHLCHRCILTMIVQNRSTVDFYTVRSCIPRVFPNPSRGRYRRLAFSAALLITGLIIAAVITHLWPVGLSGTAAPPLASSRPDDRASVTDPHRSAAGRSTDEQQTDQAAETLPSPAMAKAPPSATAPPSAPPSGAAAVRHADSPPTDPPVSGQPPDSLGRITLARNETLSGIIQTVYGRFNSRYFRRLILANPHILDPDRIDVGQSINLPAIPVSVDRKPAEARWWLQINRTDQIDDAMPLVRNWPVTAPAIRLVPNWHPDSGYQIWILAKQAFNSKASAQTLLNRLPADLASTSRVVAVRTKNVVFYADPFF